MLYECLYTAKDNKFIVAKPSPAEWGEGEKSATFVIKTEELTADELNEKIADRVAKAKADVAEAIARNKKPLKAVN